MDNPIKTMQDLGFEKTPEASVGDAALAVFFLVIVGMLVAMVLLPFYLTRTKRILPSSKKLKIESPDIPITMAALSNHGELTLIADGYTHDDRRFSYVMGLSLIYSPDPLYGLYMVELPFVSSAHILGLSKDSTFPAKIQVKGSTMEEMVLEGDYPNYFSLYIEKGQQMEGRYVLDPAAMMYTVEFCKKFNWEIVDDNLFFLSTGELASHELVDKFIDEIRPAVDSGKKSSRHSHDLPYVVIQPLKMDCPVCQTRMKPGKEWLECPNQHGVLIEGGQMSRLRAGTEAKVLRGGLFGVEKSDRQLICPHCRAPMVATKFQNTNRYVDICSSCRYRWLDYNEVTEIAGIERALIQKEDL